VLHALVLILADDVQDRFARIGLIIVVKRHISVVLFGMLLKVMYMRDAGSEKTKTDVATTHGQMIESNNINRSLLVLGENHLHRLYTIVAAISETHNDKAK